MDEDRYYNLGSHDKLFNQIDELTDALASRDAEIESLRQQLASLKAELKAIGEAINDPRTDLTMTMSEVIVEQKQQLAAALAAIKVKDAFIEKIAKQTPEKPDYWTPCGQCEYNTYDAEDLLAIQPDDSALKAWLGEPVAWRYELKAGEYTFSEKRYLNEQYAAKPTPLYAPKGMK